MIVQVEAARVVTCRASMCVNMAGTAKFSRGSKRVFRVWEGLWFFLHISVPHPRCSTLHGKVQIGLVLWESQRCLSSEAKGLRYAHSWLALCSRHVGVEEPGRTTHEKAKAQVDSHAYRGRFTHNHHHSGGPSSCPGIIQRQDQSADKYSAKHAQHLPLDDQGQQVVGT